MIVSKIKKAVESNPNTIAYQVHHEGITYRDLWDRACEYATLLKRQGTSPVIVYGHKSIHVILSILSCIIADRPYVPVGPCTPLYRVRQIIKATKSSLVLAEDGGNPYSVDCLALDGLRKFENDAVQERHNDVVYIIFTSGSTGAPKGVPISKANLNNFIEWISSLKPLCDYRDIRVLDQASFSFDLSVADLYYSLCNGHTLIAPDKDIREDYNGIFAAMAAINVAVMTPTLMKLCLLNADFNEQNYPALRCVYFCGEPLEVKTVRKLFGAFPDLTVINAYGPTEATSAVSAIQITKEMADECTLLPVGETKTFATEIAIIDDEIVLKGKSVFGGYLSGDSGGYYRENNINCYQTGDIGYIEDGKLYCRGRKDSQIKYKGYRIELHDIEYHINLIKGVKDCAVVAKYDHDMVVKTLKAFVVAEDGVDDHYIKCELGKYLPGYMIPKTIRLMEKLPVTPNGKIDRKALSER